MSLTIVKEKRFNNGMEDLEILRSTHACIKYYNKRRGGEIFA